MTQIVHFSALHFGIEIPALVKTFASDMPMRSLDLIVIDGGHVSPITTDSLKQQEE